MDIRLISLGIGVLVAIGTLGLLYAIRYRGIDVARIREDLEESKRGWRDYVKHAEAVFKSLGSSIPRPAEELSKQGLRLVQAGIRRKDGAVLFLGVQVGLALTVLLTFLLTGYPRINTLVAMALSVLIGALIPGRCGGRLTPGHSGPAGAPGRSRLDCRVCRSRTGPGSGAAAYCRGIANGPSGFERGTRVDDA